MDMQDANNAITRYSATNLGNGQLQTLNLAFNLFNNRPSAPYRNNHYQGGKEHTKHARMNSDSKSSTGGVAASSSNHTSSSLNSHDKTGRNRRTKRNSNASNTATSG